MDNLDRMVIAHLRSLSAEGLIELLREARVCVGWETDFYGCYGYEPVECLFTADRDTVVTLAGDATAEEKRAAEDAAIAAGYRVPWRQT